MKAKRFIYAKKFEGEPKISDFELVEEELPDLKDGEILCQAEYLSVDPYMRVYVARYSTGITMIGGQVARIIESKHEKFPVGEYVFGNFGWRTHTIYDAKKNSDPNLALSSNAYLLPPFGDLPKSLGISYIGMPGNTAYFGFLEICQPKPNETVVVSGAAGAVGTIVGQIAKLKGCKVIGIAGTKEKCDWIVNDLGFDHAIDYKENNIEEALRQAAPNGVDCYFDNVGGIISTTVIGQMNNFGRISVCGAISGYNAGEEEKLPQIQHTMVAKQIRMEGFIVTRWNSRWMEGIEHIRDWIKDGKIKYNETILNGFENMPNALIELFQGKNFGKMVIKV